MHSTRNSIIVCIAVLMLALCGCSAAAEKPDEPMEVSDTPYTWSFEPSQDMQEPELPTGCEATATGTLLRMNGVVVTKQQVADNMPKSSSDFVNAFLGDPSAPDGWACMAPCCEQTANRFLEFTGLAACDITGTSLGELPTPCAVWVTINMDAPMWSGLEQDGYRLANNPHCVVVTGVSDGYVHYIDPLQGVSMCANQDFESVFDAMGKQAVYITELTDALRIGHEARERKD